MKNPAPEKALWMVVQEKCVPQMSIAATNMFVWMQMKPPEPVYQYGERNRENIATMTLAVNLVSYVWDQVEKEHVKRPHPEIKSLARIAEQVVIAMSAKACVANLQGEQEANQKRYAPIMLTLKIALDQLQQTLFSDLGNSLQEKKG
jgi:hypothetical protein